MASSTPTKAFFELGNLGAAGFVELGFYRGQRGSVDREVPDGDTISVRAGLDFSVRFLGVDAPEKGFNVPEPVDPAAPGAEIKRPFVGLDNPRWTAYLTDPFGADYAGAAPVLSTGLRDHLRGRIGVETGSASSRRAIRSNSCLSRSASSAAGRRPIAGSTTSARTTTC